MTDSGVRKEIQIHCRCLTATLPLSLSLMTYLRILASSGGTNVTNNLIYNQCRESGDHGKIDVQSLSKLEISTLVITWPRRCHERVG